MHQISKWLNYWPENPFLFKSTEIYLCAFKKFQFIIDAGIKWIKAKFSRNLSVVRRDVDGVVCSHGIPYRFRYITTLHMWGVQPPLAKQSPTYNKYYTYLTYVRCRHVLFIALDSKIIGENGCRFLLFLFDNFIVVDSNFFPFDFTYVRKRCELFDSSTYAKLRHPENSVFVGKMPMDRCVTNLKPHLQLWLLLLIGASILLCLRQENKHPNTI